MSYPVSYSYRQDYKIVSQNYHFDASKYLTTDRFLFSTLSDVATPYSKQVAPYTIHRLTSRKGVHLFRYILSGFIKLSSCYISSLRQRKSFSFLEKILYVTCPTGVVYSDSKHNVG